MPTLRSLSLITFVALGAIALTASSAAFAQAYGSRYGGYVDYDDDEHGAPVPPRPIPDYRRGAVETVVTTTRRVVTSRPADYEYGDPDDDVTMRRVIVPAPRRAYPADVVATGSVLPRPYYQRHPVYKSEPVYAPPPAWRDEVVAVRPRFSAQPVIIEERRVETTRRILAPTPVD